MCAVQNCATAAEGRIEADAQRIEQILALTQLPPAYIISMAWLRLEQAIREAVNIPPSRAGNRRPARSLDYLNLANVQGLLTGDEMPAVRRLREMRNLAAHSLDPPITMTDALRYQDMAEVLIQTIKQRAVQAKKGATMRFSRTLVMRWTLHLTVDSPGQIGVRA